MKKWIALLLAMSICILCAACGGEKAPETTNAPAVNTPATEAPAVGGDTPATEAPEAPAEMTAEEKALAEAEIRYAISLLFDRNYIVNDVAQGGQLPASSFVAMGMTDADGSEFYKNAGSSDEFDGYYNVSKEAFEANYAEAYAILSKYYEVDENGMFTNFPTLTYLYNTSEGHKAIGEYLQSALAGVGITMNLENQEWNTFLNTRKNGDYSIARNGWLADYNDPICFLDMWTTASGNNDVQFGKGEHEALAMYNMDLTPAGIIRTLEVSRAAGLATLGSQMPGENRYSIVEVNGIKIGMVNYTYGSYWNTNGFSTSNLGAFAIEKADSRDSQRYIRRVGSLRTRSNMRIAEWSLLLLALNIGA